jgi:adenylosuccinate lyase
MTPFEDRYKSKIKELSSIFGEKNYLELAFTIEKRFLLLYYNKFNDNPNSDYLNCIVDIPYNYNKIKSIESVTKHDIVAVTEYIKQEIELFKHCDHKDWLINSIHFGLTSQDIVSLANSIMCDKAYAEIRKITDIFHGNLITKPNKPFIGLTHGQKAVPMYTRHIYNNIIKRTEHKLIIPLSRFGNGTIGNGYSFKNVFDESEMYKYHMVCTKLCNLFTVRLIDRNQQTDYYPSIVFTLREIERLSLSLENFCVDMWGYISKDWFRQENILTESGSSTMSQKVNPISFENAEGNFYLARTLANSIANKLSISRYERDLSDVTVIRNLSLVFGYYIIAMKSLIDGIEKCNPNDDTISFEHKNGYEMLAESVNLILRKNNVPNSYDISKNLFKGKHNITRLEFIDIIFECDSIPEQIKLKIKNLEL